MNLPDKSDDFAGDALGNVTAPRSPSLIGRSLLRG
jgi:hypothetical protein